MARWRNVWILGVSQALGMSAPPLVLLVGGLVGADLAPSPALATLPLSIGVIGVALFSIPAGMIMQRIGRRRGFFIAALTASLAALLAAFAIARGSFILFCLATLFLGLNNAFVQQYRFAAAESVPAGSAGRAVSLVLLSGVLAGLLGPEIGKRARDLLPFGTFSGSFVVMAGLLVAAALLLLFLHEPPKGSVSEQGPQRPLRSLLAQRDFRIALLAAGVAYGVMSFIMTATPLQMHSVSGHSLDATTLVIQSHLVAMFLPSLITGLVIERLGTQRVMEIGALVLAACVLVGLLGQEVFHFWGALVLLGAGWNFLFVAGTTLLTHTYRPEERFKAQSFNDFTIFAVQAAASLSAGAVLFAAGWTFLILVSLVPLLALAFILVRLRRSPVAPEQPASTD